MGPELIAVAAAVALIVGYGAACYNWGKFKAKRDLLLLKEIQHDAAMDAITKPPPTDAVLLDELSTPGWETSRVPTDESRGEGRTR